MTRGVMALTGVIVGIGMAVHALATNGLNAARISVRRNNFEIVLGKRMGRILA